MRRSLGMLGDVIALTAAITADLVTGRRGAVVEHSGNAALAHAAQQIDLDVRAFFDAEFVIHMTVPYRKGQAKHSAFAAAKLEIGRLRN